MDNAIVRGFAGNLLRPRFRPVAAALPTGCGHASDRLETDPLRKALQSRGLLLSQLVQKAAQAVGVFQPGRGFEAAVQVDAGQARVS